MSQLATHIIAYVDSHRRISGSHTNFVFPIEVPRYGGFDSICVLQASIPKSYYLIATGANTFELDEEGMSVTVTVPIGNYTRKSLAAQLTTSLREASPRGLYYTVSIPSSIAGPDTGKYTYAVQNSAIDTGIPPYIITFEFAGTYQPCESMGFTINTIVEFDAGTLISENVCRLQAKNTIYIKSNCIDNGGTQVLQAIFGADPDFTVINFQVGNAGGMQANRKELVLSNSNAYQFVITDEDDFQLDTNGLSVQMSVMIWNSKRYSYSALR